MTDERTMDGFSARPHGSPCYEAEVMLNYPFLALGKGCTEELSFFDASNKTRLVVTTDRPDGMAFVSDVNVLIWVISELRERLLVRNEDRRDIVLSIAHSKLLRYIGKSPGGRQSKLLYGTLERLCATRVETNLPLKMTKGKVFTFHLLERCEPSDADDPVWTITPPDWLIEVVQQKCIVRVNPDSMKLTGIPRCVYRYARATVGDSVGFMDLDPARAADRFGSTGKTRVRSMRHKLKKLVADLERSRMPGNEPSEPQGSTAPRGEEPKPERQIAIPDYRITASPTDGITIDLDPGAWPLKYLLAP